MSEQNRLEKGQEMKKARIILIIVIVLLALIVSGVFSILALIGAFVKGSYTTVSNGLPDGSE